MQLRVAVALKLRLGERSEGALCDAIFFDFGSDCGFGWMHGDDQSVVQWTIRRAGPNGEMQSVIHRLFAESSTNVQWSLFGVG